jgi:O-Antigen ligase
VRRAVLLTAAAVLLAGPTALAFFSGGFFDEPRLVAALAAWVLVLVVALLGPRPLPVRAPGWAVVGSLAFLTAWSALSLSWAPLSGPATDNVQRLLLYLGTLVAAVGLLRLPVVSRAVEPALALGVSVVIGYGLSGRLLPGVIELSRSSAAGGRLEQPITYWNAEGALAAIGFVLCARIAGDGGRPAALRALATAACAPLGMGLYLSYSRGAIAAAVVGLIVLLAVAPTRTQLRAVAGAVIAGLVAGACSAAFPGVARLSGSADTREEHGAIMLAILIAVMLAAGATGARAARARQQAEPGGEPLRFARRLPAVAAAAVALAVAGLVAGGLGERGEPNPETFRETSASRLTSVSSRRYDYWRIGLRAFERHPLEGLGSGGFRTAWLRERPVKEGVLEVHSLELEMAAELGVPGLLGLAVMLGGAAAAGRRALRCGRPIAAGCCAAGTVWLLHASIDWDWQLPAVTLPVVIMAGGVVAASEEPLGAPDAAAPVAGERHAGAAGSRVGS